MAHVGVDAMTDPGGLAARRFEHQGLLGTLVEVRVAADTESEAEEVDAAILATMQRLERVFSAYDETSELCRWRRGELAYVSTEFAELMAVALRWQEWSAGRFNPLVGELSALWQAATTEGVPPASDVLVATAEAIRSPRYEMIGGRPVARGDCSAFNLNAIAKGFIVDRAVDAVDPGRHGWICVNAGGDLRVLGAGAVEVGIENPHRPYDNEPPLQLVTVQDAAIATSGLARRGFRVGGRWFGHVLDPRSGRPVDQIASITVVAPDAMTADALATVAGVESPADAIARLDRSAGVEGFVIDDDGEWRSTSGWDGRASGNRHPDQQ